MGKLTAKGKHMGNMGNNLHTNMICKPLIRMGEEYKCWIFKVDFKLRDT